MNEGERFSEESLRRIASQKVSYRYSVRIHIVVYILVNILLFVINLLTATPIITFQTSWFLYPLLGWFIGLSIHMVSYIMFAKGVFPLAKRGVIYHFTAYITVIILLSVNNLQIIPHFLWALWPGILWGIGFAGHAIIYLIYFKSKITETGDIKSRREQAIERELEKMKRRIEKK